MSEPASPQVATRSFKHGTVVEQDFDLDAVSEQLDEDDTVVWIDLMKPDAALFDKLSGELGLHELAIDNALEPHQRPKVNYYSSHLFLSCHSVGLDADTATLVETEIDLFVGPRWIITVRQDSGFDMGGVVDRCHRSPDLVAHGVGFLLYALLDVVIDSYFSALDVLDDYYDDVSDSIFNERAIDPKRQRHSFGMRRALMRLHRLTAPMREAVGSLIRRENDVIQADLRPYFQDLYDHVLRASESTDSLRDLVTTIVETNLSLRDYRQNQIMKKVTSWAAVIAVPTLITGYYGMNVPYPGLNETWGWVLSVVLMAVLSGGLYFEFRRHDWL